MPKETKIYDKVEWHTDAGVPAQEAKKHLEVIMDWLDRRCYLSEEGAEAHSIGVDSDFSLHSRMLTGEADEIIRKKYDVWLSDYVSKGDLDTSIFDQGQS